MLNTDLDLTSEIDIPLDSRRSFGEEGIDEEQSKMLWALLASYLPLDTSQIQKMFVKHAEYDLAETFNSISEDKHEQYRALAFSVRDRLVERWKDTELHFQSEKKKRVYYLSLEFLMGRTLQNSLANLELVDIHAESLRQFGIRLEDLYDEERDAGLGNGGLGRLAACFLDSLATLNYPAGGYGLRYRYGIFHQLIKDGYQVEVPDYWLEKGNPWEIPRYEVQFPVHFYGYVEDEEEDGVIKRKWKNYETVLALPYDVPIPGYHTYNTINLRLWNSKPSTEFNLEKFNQGDYFSAVAEKQTSETITSVLYPNDNTFQGKELRLKQQYFFVCATLQDILRKFLKQNEPLSELPNYVCIQLNDTHPSLAIPELMRVLMDEYDMKWKEAWNICIQVFSYTNHTVLPEALEKWSIDLLSNLLPRHLEIMYKINHKFLKHIRQEYGEDPDLLRDLSIVEEGSTKKIRMANLAIIGSHHVNGVAAIHSNLITTDIFPHFFKIWPEKFVNVTNGVTQRRWMHVSNPSLSELITDTLGSNEWLDDMNLLEDLKNSTEDEKFRTAWHKAKRDNKVRLADWLLTHMNLNVNADALFDIQIKRIHEYKRQFMNILSVIWRYRYIKGLSDEEKSECVPRVIIFAGKAAPGYYMAKMVIKLITTVANKINNDPDVENLLTIAFIPDYCVSLAEILIPASDISQHISTAGTEASGTSNMKFAMNGGLIIGTMDGANIEICEHIGRENMFIFGAETEEVPVLRQKMREGTLKPDPRFYKTVELLEEGFVGTFRELPDLLNTIKNGNDYYLVAADFGSYLDAQDLIDKTYKDQDAWTKMSILSTAQMGFFSSDRSIHDYAEKIWGIETCKKPDPVPVDPGIIHQYVSQDTAAPLSVSPGISLERYSGNTPVSQLSLSPLEF
eukprot:TRINITY_DN5405_c0_g1_i1.p1 TRINITY_DN5405_c0_g1~~TRINITY_DN5405_c0_g1_i1.p1  ORF type:complete len:905 (-),score=220.09 TRINITY_DN5405_c0_g1_i1:50-2764(-)